MARTRVVLNDEAIGQIKRSPAVRALLQGIVDKIADEANAPGGDGFAGGVDVYPNSSRGYVVTKNQHGKRAEAKDRRLTRALEAGRS